MTKIYIERKTLHGGPQSESGGIWEPGEYTVDADISKGLAEHFLAHNWCRVIEGELTAPGEPDPASQQQTITPHSMRQRSTVAQPAPRPGRRR